MDLQPKLEFLFASRHPQGKLVEYHDHGALEIVYYTEGEGEIWLDKEHGLFKPGVFHIAPKSMRHKQLNRTELRAICIGVSGSGLDELAGIWTDRLGALRRPCEELLLEQGSKAIGSESVARGLLLQVIGLARRAALEPAQEESPGKGIVARALRMIDESNGGLSLDEISDNLYVSKDYLRHLLTKATGQSPIRHLIKKRLERAHEMLLKDGATVAETASRCGFSDVYYFSRLFKSRYNLPPAAYRDSRKSR